MPQFELDLRASRDTAQQNAQRVIETAATLGKGQSMVAQLSQVPSTLLDLLEELGFRYDLNVRGAEDVGVLITRRSGECCGCCGGGD
ncbi:hypothetical protein [Tahibacter amnicola]|uniref:Uncharacterized protein n=1 Tax=Tahibacter amnicola TaxID=2976241 RepID=A0ABY6BL37_9GAMM|nr:hypothetical protein [Tahibacter amnicola]MCU7376015.1 hypothetical protein [Paucibacter sp. O1-1]MDA3831027.1 hypothetical protein [Paucibacter sp. O1-1]UXI70479.1 hypothetical protein N4264_12830 [Tahibacter amnicola]